MSERVEGSVIVENARIIFRNFTGNETEFNRKGNRNFCLVLDDLNLAKQMDADGWNIKALRAREEGDPDQPYIQINVAYKGRPPRIVMITSRGRTELSEDECEILDWADIKSVDLIFNPYNWSVRGDTGVSAYLKSMYVTIEEDALELKYADLEHIPSRSGRVSE
jgi:hypothetical protein